jgi:hypothetical protein
MGLVARASDSRRVASSRRSETGHATAQTIPAIAATSTAVALSRQPET